MSSPTPVPTLYSLLSGWRQVVRGTRHAQPPPYDGPDLPVPQLTEDTRNLQPGGCFVARVRTTSDGHSWIAQAIANGAGLILAQRPAAEAGVQVPDGVVYWQVPDTAVTLAWLAAAWHDFPSRELVTIGITGTNGKTTTAQLLYEILRAGGLQVGMISTIVAMIGDREESTGLHVSTPEAPVVQQYLRRMVRAGMTHVVLETTSHGLAEHRVTAVDFDIAVITNITHEHLDYHGSFAAYAQAKARLFQMLGRGSWRVPGGKGQAAGGNRFKKQVPKTAVLNRDDSSFAQLCAIEVPRRLIYGMREPAGVRADSPNYSAGGVQFALHLPHAAQSIPVASPLVGAFNVYNMLAAAGAAAALDLAPEVIRAGLERVTAVSGRMQPIDRGQPFPVIVDFAHTPDALAKAIGVARTMTSGRIITVFGSAGGRDVEKRRLMAEISAREADLSILTAEDPRQESLDKILAMMADGCRSQGGVEKETFWRVPDRGCAIYQALALAQPDDLVLVCGKGHEQSMCFGTTEFPWDDRRATAAALDAFQAGKPMPDLGLPTYMNPKT